MRGALAIAWIQSRQSLAWFSVITFALTWLLSAPFGPIRDGVLKLVSETPFLQKLVGGVMGIDLTGELTVKLLVGSTWAHPFLLALVWGFAVLGASRFPAQEIEQGFIDTLMSQPLSRTKALAAHALTTLAGTTWLLLIALLGFTLGCRNLGEDAPEAAEMLPVALALWASSVLVLGLATLLSVLSRERGRVLGAMLGVVLWSLLLAYLQPFVSWSKSLASLGLLHYYRPGEILQSGDWPVRSALMLTTVGLALWLGAALRFRQRDL